MGNITVGKKSLTQGECDTSVGVPESCRRVGFCAAAIPGGLTDRAVRPSKRCNDPNMYETWCGDYCDRGLEDFIVPNAAGINTIMTNQSQLCELEQGDNYMGCFNEAYLFKLKEGETFNPNGNNIFDVYIKGNTIPECRSVADDIERIAKARGLTPNAAVIQCYRDLTVKIRCEG